MHTAEEVRKDAAKYYDELTTGVHDMLLAYADLLEAMEEFDNGVFHAGSVHHIRQRADEKQKGRNG